MRKCSTDKPENCPHCGVSLKGTEIPEKDRHYYNALNAKPGDEGWVTHGRREIGIQVMGVYDGVLYWRCPDCAGTWNRWPNNEFFRSLHDAAEREMNRKAKA